MSPEEVTTALDDVGVYQEGETVLKRQEAGYRVEHGIGRRPPLRFDTLELSDAIQRFTHWRHRPCTSCGQPGCAHDLVGTRPLVIDPLPQGPLP